MLKMAMPNRNGGDTLEHYTGTADADEYAKAARAEALDEQGEYHEWVLALGIKERNKMIARMQLNPGEKTVLVNAVRKFKQLISKRKYVTRTTHPLLFWVNSGDVGGLRRLPLDGVWGGFGGHPMAPHRGFNRFGSKLPHVC